MKRLFYILPAILILILTISPVSYSKAKSRTEVNPEFRAVWVTRFEWPDADEAKCKAKIMLLQHGQNIVLAYNLVAFNQVAFQQTPFLHCLAAGLDAAAQLDEVCQLVQVAGEAEIVGVLILHDQVNAVRPQEESYLPASCQYSVSQLHGPEPIILVAVSPMH